MKGGKVSDLKFNIDIDSISSEFGELKKEVNEDLKNAVGALASMTHAKANELATEQLGSLQKIYKDNLSFQQLEENLWVVSLDEKALFIEEGRKSGFMQELLNSPTAKTAKDGTKYNIIPFEHSKNPSEQSSRARELTNQIKAELKKQGVNYRKPEYNADGSPKLGLIKRFNIDSAKLKESHKDSPLKGVSIYQRMEGNKVRRDVMTFRVITEKHREENKWVHPGMEGKKILDQAFSWAESEWNNVILSEVLSKYDK